MVHVPPVGVTLAVPAVVRSKLTVKLAVPFNVPPVRTFTKSAVAEVVTTETVCVALMYTNEELMGIQLQLGLHWSMTRLSSLLWHHSSCRYGGNNKQQSKGC